MANRQRRSAGLLVFAVSMFPILAAAQQGGMNLDDVLGGKKSDPPSTTSAQSDAPEFVMVSVGGKSLDDLLGGTSLESAPPPIEGDSLDWVLLSVNDEIEENRAERVRQVELEKLAKERQRIQAEIAAEQQRVATQMRQQALAAQRRQEEARQQQQQSAFGRALFGAALGYGVGAAGGLDGAGRLELATEYMKAVSNNDIAGMKAATERISNDFIARKNTELKMNQARDEMLRTGTYSPTKIADMQRNPAGTPVGGMPSGLVAPSANVKPHMMPAICSSGNVDVQIDSHCQQAKHYYDMYAANAGHPGAEQAYDAHVAATRNIQRIAAATKSSVRAPALDGPPSTPVRPTQSPVAKSPAAAACVNRDKEISQCRRGCSPYWNRGDHAGYDRCRKACVPDGSCPLSAVR